MASTWYIGPGGNDTTGVGSLANPYLTVSKAGSVMSNGDTILCQDGVYTAFAPPNNKTNITIQAVNVGMAVFTLTGVSGALLFSTGQTITFVGLKFLNWVFASGGNLIAIATGSVVTFQNCTFKNIQLFTNLISNNGGSWTLTFTNCLFDDVYRNPASANTVVLVASNIATITWTGCTISFRTAPMGGLVLVSSGQAVVMVIKNTIVHNLTGGTVSYNTSGTGVTSIATYSDFYLITGRPTGTGVITSDPLFIDAPNSNFRLRPTSPCRNAGVTV